MHDIKYFFLNKNNQIIQGRRDKKKFRRRKKLSKVLFKITIFQNSERVTAPLAPHAAEKDLLFS
jgi:hypothetical protein